MDTALFAGTFDPPTRGHLDIIQRASKLCKKLYVAVTVNTSKEKGFFSVSENQKMLLALTKKYKNVEVITYSRLLAGLAKRLSVDCLIRGLRGFSDMDYEFRMALANRKLCGIETLFIMGDEHLSHVHSSLIREIAFAGGPLKEFVFPEVEKAIKRKIGRRPIFLT